jgi:hypothetical protein
MSDKELIAELLAALKNALKSLDMDGPSSAAASLAIHGRAAVRKAEQHGGE